MNKKWVSVWGNAISIVDNKPESYAKNITLRYPILMPFDGNQIRLTLDNFTGTETVAIDKITVAKAINDQDFDEGSVCEVTFGGKTGVTLKAKENRLSDSIDFIVKKEDKLMVSLYLKDFTLMRSGVALFTPLCKAYYALGDQTESAVFPRELSKEIQWFYFLSQIDVCTEENAESIICYGDSITAQSWPDRLQRKLLENNEKTAVIRRAVSGSRVLRQYDCLMYESYGIQGLVRFEHEAHACGANTVIILQGVNDLIHPVGEEVNQFRPWSDLPTAEELIQGLRTFIQQAKRDGMKVIVGTILPIKGWRTYEDFRNQLRMEINEWIRNTNEIDAFVDFDALMKDYEDPAMLYKEYDSGDHLHPSEKGHQCMCDETYRVLMNLKEKAHE